MKRIAILGSTGSIGTQALDIVNQNRDRFQVSILACGKNRELLEQQIRDFAPKAVSVASEEDARILRQKFPHVEVLCGKEGLLALAAAGSDYDVLLNSLVGIAGLEPTLQAVNLGKDVALANKETLVAGGNLVMAKARETGSKIIPVDSEHSAVFQCLQGTVPAGAEAAGPVPPHFTGEEIKKLLLTASGGPFRGYTTEQLGKVTAKEALRHPNWSMGAKVTIDSAGLMNKGLEVMEACHLFNLPVEKVQVVVHPESIIHSMVEFRDGAILAQMGAPDMRVPIAYALSFPQRVETGASSVDFFAMGSFHFEPADLKTFRCLALAMDAYQAGGTYPVVLNAANEVLVAKFLKGEIGFLQIPDGIEKAMLRLASIEEPTLEEILEIDRRTREEIFTC